MTKEEAINKFRESEKKGEGTSLLRYLIEEITQAIDYYKVDEVPDVGWKEYLLELRNKYIEEIG